ncbi:hypothetical protein COB11_03375 [Candidatus Aerophobetes bacterium]|uniref:Uncharacterized protein n=1 Tax=Aerophobetes bacterium TaxID=2030807 RepID=A0A2A4YIU6_UNCAE|nr:MAG: hypothetical protein COB11_03375 [Candidatus Aerophobetes bacterium]
MLPFFFKARFRIGTSLLSKIFTDLRRQLKIVGLMNEVFNFVDASSLISKEKDKVIQLPSILHSSYG